MPQILYSSISSIRSHMPAAEATMKSVRGELERHPRSRSADLISDLGDDVLLRILALLPDAGDAVRTGALARRWRGLWTRVPALRFATETELSDAAAAERYVAFIDGALAALHTGSAIEHLGISFKTTNNNYPDDREFEQLVPPWIDAAQGWIQYAVRHSVRSFDLELVLPLPRRVNIARGVLILDELPSSTRLETLRLAMRHTYVQLPATAVFASLTDLSLESIMVAYPGDHLLARLLSPACCPRLQKLRLRKLGLPYLTELPLEAGMLLELSLEKITLYYVTLTAPNLRVLRMDKCKLGTLTISAPRLEELAASNKPGKVVVSGDLSCVGILKVQIQLSPYDYGDENNVSMQLLQCCTAARCLELYLSIDKADKKISIPQLPHVTSLTLHVSLDKLLHSYGAWITDILTQCSNLRCLRLHVVHFWEFHLRGKFTCCHPNQWHSHEMSFAHLHEVEFRGLAGTDCELWFMQAVISSTACLQKVAISFDPKFRFIGSRDASKLQPKVSGVWTAAGKDASLAYEWEWRSCV